MIKEFVRYWEVGKENLRDYFKETKQEKYLDMEEEYGRKERNCTR